MKSESERKRGHKAPRTYSLNGLDLWPIFLSEKREECLLKNKCGALLPCLTIKGRGESLKIARFSSILFFFWLLAGSLCSCSLSLSLSPRLPRVVFMNTTPVRPLLFVGFKGVIGKTREVRVRGDRVVGIVFFPHSCCKLVCLPFTWIEVRGGGAVGFRARPSLGSMILRCGRVSVLRVFLVLR